MNDAIEYALKVLEALKPLIDAGVDAYGLITETRQKLQEFRDQGRDPSQDEWDALDARISDLQGRLHAP